MINWRANTLIMMNLVGILFLLFSCSNVNEEGMNNELKFLALGDSYTIGESVEEMERWPNQLVVSLREVEINFAKPKIIATTGWRTDQLKKAILDDGEEKYDMVSLLIGVNDQYQQVDFDNYEPQFTELLELAINKASGKKENVFVVSIPDYSFTPFGEKNKEKITKELNEYNRVNREVSIAYGVQYFYITDISRSHNPSMVAKDGLHPSGTQYAQWVSLMIKELSFFSTFKQSD